MRRTLRNAIFGTALAAVASALVPGMASAEPVKIAYIDPLSGGFANIGNAGLAHFRFMAEQLNAENALPDGLTYEIVPFDNKINAAESLTVLQSAIDQGIRYVVQGNGSSVAHALVDAINKYNQRNPGEELLFLNYAAIDPALTNEKCSFWHFRFDAHVDMKIAAMTDYLVDRPEIKKIYLINQDYSFGHAVAAAAEKMIAEKRPDIEIVGNDLHPLVKVKDFSPYVAKIQQSGADAVITGNWGNDLSLLVNAGKDSGLDVEWLTFYAGLLGGVSALGDAGVDHVRQISEWHSNVPNEETDAIVTEFKAQYPEFDWAYYRVGVLMDMLTKAINEAGSADPKAVAFALEDMRIDTPVGEVWMRKDDHQSQQKLYLATLAKGQKFDLENSGIGFKTDQEFALEDTVLPTTCEMQRPE
ncbi:branched-chain amino acid ABC transporter substrate-binding protein [Microbaculum marinum]|uniref:Branched-chain amino acid ABC transporter substrate-binding protein n=1 Tax=Microbaculum marinum TaxID=1764581 RepID=A0AAW9RF10_9HYPH